MSIITATSIMLICNCISGQDSLTIEWDKMHQSKIQSLEKFNEAKFGMFIHFGVYSSLGGYWKGNNIKGIGECIMRYGEIPRSEYIKICKQFNPIHFSADEWVKAAKMAGMQYIVAMPKHADGFAMYNSKETKYDIVDMTKFKRDPIAELYQACKKYGLSFSIYFNYLDWMDGGNGGVIDYENKHPEEDKSYQYWANTWDPSPVSFTEYFEKKYKPQLRELLTKFPGLQELWHDMPMKITRQQSFEVYKMVYELQPTILDNSRIGNNFGDYWIPGDNIIPEKLSGEEMKDDPINTAKMGKIYWETPGTMNNTWGYRGDDQDWKSIEELLYWLTEITSKGGNYLLNIGPMADGTFPEASRERLKEIGKWMSVNGESVYGTSCWIVSHEGPTFALINGTDKREKEGFNANITPRDFWFSKKGKNIYITSLKWPESQNILIKSFNNLTKDEQNNIESIELLGSNEEVLWKIEEKGLKVNIPLTKPNSHGYVLKVSMKM